MDMKKHMLGAFSWLWYLCYIMKFLKYACVFLIWKLKQQFNMIRRNENLEQFNKNLK